MRRKVIDQYSYTLNRNMKVRIYGHYGDTFLFFPSQDHQSDDYENFGVISSLSDFIEQGKIKIVCIDGIDYESFSSSACYEHRAYMQEQYYHYVINEVLPLIYSDNHGFCLPFVSVLYMQFQQIYPNNHFSFGGHYKLCLSNFDTTADL